MRGSIVLNRPSWEFARPITPTKNQTINLGSVIGRIEQEQGRRRTPSQKREMEAWFEASFGGLGSHRCGRDLTKVPDGHRGLQNQDMALAGILGPAVESAYPSREWSAPNSSGAKFLLGLPRSCGGRDHMTMASAGISPLRSWPHMQKS